MNENLEQKWDAEEQAVFAACKAMNEAIHSDMRPAAYVEVARTVRKLMDALGASPDIQEYTDELRGVSPAFLGQLLMETTTDPSGGVAGADEPFPVFMKKYWLEVAVHMGPDWIDELDRAVNWMKRVEGFK